MFKIDRIACWLFIVYFIVCVFSIEVIKPLDELFAVGLVVLSLMDCIFNGRWRHYRPMFIAIGVLSFYAVYSVTAVHFNTVGAVLKDMVIELKPYLVAICTYCIAPRFTAGDKRILRGVCRVMFVLLLAAGISFIAAYNFLVDLFFHVAYVGQLCFVTAVIYIYISVDDEGRLKRSGLIFALALLCVGFLCTRSKYYGEFVVLLFFLFVYRRGMLRHLTLSNIVVLGSVLVLVLAVVWQKFDYYFLSVNLGSIDLNNLPSFARMALYAGLIFILIDYPVFGSGLASFASFPSSEPYSLLYAEYGLDKVWGLSEEKPDFICDAYYASLAQYGVVGILIFIYFWVWLYRNLRAMTRSADPRWHYPFIIGASLMAFELIEMTTGNGGVSSMGVLALFLLGMVAGSGKELRLQQKKIKKETESPSSLPNVKSLPERI